MYLLVSDGVETVLIMLLPESTFHVPETGMKEKLQKQRLLLFRSNGFSSGQWRGPVLRGHREEKRNGWCKWAKDGPLHDWNLKCKDDWDVHSRAKKKKKKKSINDHFHRLQWGSWSDNGALQWARSVMRAGINTWHTPAGVCPAVGQQSRGN